MSQLTIIRTPAPMPTEAELVVLRKFLFDLMKGESNADDKGWRRFWRKITQGEAGEMFFLEVIFPRNPKFHRKLFALLGVGFDSWDAARKHKTYKGREVTKNFEQFRGDVIILAGYYDQVFTLKGKMKLVPKSIKFSKMDDEEFEALYSAIVDVLLREVCKKYAGRAEMDSVVEKILGFI